MQLNEPQNASVFVILVEPEAQEANPFVDGDVINFLAENLTPLLSIWELCT